MSSRAQARDDRSQLRYDAYVALSALEDKSHQPTASDLAATIGKSTSLWKTIVTEIAKAHSPIDEVWNFAGAKFGWSLRLRKRDRVILYLIPQTNGFLAGIVLGEKAVEAAREAHIREDVRTMIDAARPYAEGRGIRLPVTNGDDVKVVLDLVALKMRR